MAIVYTQLTEIAMDIDFGHPGESKSFLADSGCLVDETCAGYRSITVNRWITVPGEGLSER